MDSKQSDKQDATPTVRSNELLACPFCGSAPRRVRVEPELPTRKDLLWQVECSSRSCGAKTMPRHPLIAAEALWNRRANHGLDLSNTLTAGRESPRAPGYSHARQVVDQMLAYLHQHYSRPMNLRDMAADLHMNATYLSNLFSTTTGVTFRHYLERLRLAKAKELLRDPLKRISEVAYAVGYADANYFRDAFKARVGAPPSVWRTRPSR